MISLEECERKGLIRRIPPSPRLASEHLQKARALLAEVEDAVKGDKPTLVLIGGYSAMFGAGRALLFLDGYRERSHACVARFIEARYGDRIGQDHIDLLDRYRTKRHNAIYGAEYYPDNKEARDLVKVAREFITIVGEIIGK